MFGSLFPAHRGIGHRSRRRSVVRPSSGALAAAQVGECAEQAQGGAHCRAAHAARMERAAPAWKQAGCAEQQASQRQWQAGPPVLGADSPPARTSRQIAHGPRGRLQTSRTRARSPRARRPRGQGGRVFFIFVFFLKKIYKNIFLVLGFTVLYPCRPVGGR